jgi:membrane peptidoglycan carboxypeptidase
MEAGRDVRQEVYGWLFNTRRSAAQDQRIRSIMEAEAFREIHRSWTRLGYPFPSLVPSYATAIGTSADRPDALTELVGILLADGMRFPARMVTEAHFAADTPFETRLGRVPAEGERVLSAEVARAVRGAMTEVVDAGTAVRARNSVRSADGTPLVIGAKTGTGNNRHRTFGTGGRLLEDRALNRTSTLVFFIGDRFYGSITAFAPGPSADDYGFTSSLPSQILRMAGPMLAPLLP